ncbi:MAG: hypothetical protein WBA28_05225 [Microbacteriaceae bacterium]
MMANFGVRGRQTISSRQSQSNLLKLIFGAVLVLAAILGTITLVTSLDRTVTVYAAARILLPGDELRLSEHTTVEVRLDLVQGRYLLVEPSFGAAESEPQASTHRELSPITSAAVSNDSVYIVDRTIGVGEMIPRAALSQRSAGMTTLVLPLATEISTALDSGVMIDIWAAGDSRDEFALPPRVLVPRAVVARLAGNDGLLGSQQKLRIEVLVPQSSVAKILAAIQAGEAISVVQADFR